MATAVANHTPGPWIVEGGDTSNSFHIYSRKYHFATWTDDAAACGFDDCGSANAELIAAAPELLEACRGLARIVEAYRYTAGLGENQLKRLQFARAAIFKATGKE